MGKYIKSHSNYILQKKHQKTDDGTIFYQDQLTVNGISEFSNVDGQIPIYRDGNFLLTSRYSNGYTRSQAPRKYLNNSYSGSVWTNEVLDNYPTDKDSQIDTVQIKLSYYSLRDFSYYGSCKELIRASINDITRTFPSELYVIEKDNKGVTKTCPVIHENGYSMDTLGKDGFIYVISNPSNIDVVTKRSFSEVDNANVSSLRYFSSNGYLLYRIIDKDGASHNVTGWYVENRYLNDGTLFDGTDDEWTNIILQKKNKTCFLSGDELARITLLTDDGMTMPMRMYLDNKDNVLTTTEDFIGCHIRPNDNVISNWFLNLDRFESMLMQRDSTPVYTCKFEVLSVAEPSEQIMSELKSFSFPIAEGGWNLETSSNGYNVYLSNLSDMASMYDELFCDNLYRNMTHEAVKNMDWSVKKFYNAENDYGDEYELGQNNINKIIRLIGREFDEIKFYIDGLSQMNVLNYRDDNTNMPDYFLSDSLEIEGWEVIPPYTKSLAEYIEYSGSVIYRDVISGTNEFANTFNGIEFDVNEKENYVKPLCENKKVVLIGNNKYVVTDDNTININGKLYKETTVSGMSCFDIVDDIPYTVRYVTVDGKNYEVDEETKTLEIPSVNGEMKTYKIADGQDSVNVSESVDNFVSTYYFTYDQNVILGDKDNDTHEITFTITRTGSTHNNEPVTEGQETETFVVGETDSVVTTSGWSNDVKTGAEREYVIDPIDGKTKLYIDYADADPSNDEAKLITLSDGKNASYVRQQNPLNSDVIDVSYKGIDPNAYYATFPLMENQYEHYDKYGTASGFPADFHLVGSDDTSLRMFGTTDVASVDFDSKTINVYENKGTFDGVEYGNSEMLIAYNGYQFANGNGIQPSDTAITTCFFAEPEVEILPSATDGYKDFGRDWSTYRSEFDDLKEKNVPKFPYKSNYTYKEIKNDYTVVGNGIYKTITGTDEDGYVDLSMMVGKTYRVNFIIANAYPCAHGTSSPWVWALNDTLHTNYPNSIVCLYYDNVLKRYPHLSDSTGNDLLPILNAVIAVDVTIETGDVVTYGSKIKLGTNGDGFKTDSYALPDAFAGGYSGTLYSLLYSKALSSFKNEYTLSSLSKIVCDKFSVKTSSSDGYTNSIILPYFGSSVKLNSMELVSIAGINQQSSLEDWFPYGVYVGNISCDYTLSNSDYRISGPDANTNISCYENPLSSKFWNTQNETFPTYLTNTSYVYTLKELTVNGNFTINRLSAHTLIERYNENSEPFAVTGTTFAPFSMQFRDLTLDRFQSQLSSNMSVYDVEYCGFVFKSIYLHTDSSSKHRLNIPSLYTSNNAGLQHTRGKYIRIFAESEAIQPMLESSYTGSDATEVGKLYDLFNSASTEYQKTKNYHKISTKNTYDVNDLGWFYFNSDADTVTLSDLGYDIDVNSSSGIEPNPNSHDYVRPDSIKPLVYNEESKSYEGEDGTPLSELKTGIYYLADNGEGLMHEDTYKLPTFKDFSFELKSISNKPISKDQMLPINSEERYKHISNYYFPITECLSSDKKYKLHREFSDDSDYEYTPYDCSLDNSCGGYFYKKCCVKEPAYNVPMKVEKQPYVIYNKHKVYLCGCDCAELYYKVVINNIEYSAYTSANTINIDGKNFAIQYENILYNKISNYSSTQNYDSSNVAYHFFKNLRLNSRKLLQKKGTIEGLDDMLSLFGLKSKTWFDKLSLMQKEAYGDYDYEIREYTCLTNKIEDLYEKRFNMGKIAYYNKLKTITHNNEDSTQNKYDGLPVTYVSYYKDNSGNVTTDHYSPDMSVNVEYKKDLYPYFDKAKVYDGNTYFQMNGGWLSIYPFKYSKDNDIMLPYMDDNQIMKGLHTETLRNVRSFQNLEEMVDVSKASVIDNQIVEVQDLSKVYAVVNGRLFEVHTESYTFADNDGETREQICSYIKLFVMNHEVTVGDTTYTGILYVSDPLTYCYKNSNLESFERSYNLDEEDDGKMIKVFLYKYDNIFRKEPVNVEKDTLKDEDNMYVSIILESQFYGNEFDVFKYDDTLYSKYFKLSLQDYADTLGGYGWNQLLLTDHDAIRIDSIVDNYKANNPHSDVFAKYDNGFEYIARFAQLFRFPVQNNSFNENEFGYNGLDYYDNEVDNIDSIGFDNLVSVSGDASSYSVSGDLINTRDNYNMISDRKAHFFGNFYTNNAGCQNVFKSNHKCIDKYGMCDSVEMTDNNTQFYGINPTYYGISGNVYNLSNISPMNLNGEFDMETSYLRSNMGVSADSDDYHTERIINNKMLDINFITDFEYYSKNYLEKYKYIDDVILFYLQQMIPSTTICRINFGGATKCIIKDGSIFEVNGYGDIYVKQPDCGTLVGEYVNDIIIDSVTDLCPHDQPTTYYAVYFYDGDQLIYEEQVEIAGDVKNIPTPEKVGYDFVGWSGQLTDIRHETKVYAIWKEAEKKYKVQFFSEDIVVDTQYVKEGQSAVAPTDPKKTGYEFVGWDKQFTNITADLNVHAMYQINYYRVNFYSGPTLYDYQDVAYGHSAEAPENPTMEGRIFKGWDKDFSCIIADTDVNAIWSTSEFTVTFYAYNGGPIVKVYNNVPYGTSVNAPDEPTRTGYDFVQWDKSFASITSNTVVYGEWKVKQFTVEFMVDGAVYNSQIVNYGDSAVKPDDPKKTGYEFVGWDKSFVNITEDTQINALFNANVFSVKYYRFAGDTNVYYTYNAEYGTTLKRPSADPDREGYDFTGWDTDVQPVYKDMIVNGLWSKKVFDVNFYNDEEGKGSIYNTQQVSYGDSAVSPSEPTKEGYLFDGWDKDFSNVTENLDVYPKWKEQKIYEYYIYTN